MKVVKVYSLSKYSHNILTNILTSKQTLLNISHHSHPTSLRLAPGFYKVMIEDVLMKSLAPGAVVYTQSPSSKPSAPFDHTLYVVSLLTNLVELSSNNQIIVGMHLESVVNLLLNVLPASVREAMHKKKPIDVEMDMCSLVLAGHLTLLLGFLVKDHALNAKTLLGLLPGHSLAPLSLILVSFCELQRKADVLTRSVVTSIQDLLEVLAKIELGGRRRKKRKVETPVGDTTTTTTADNEASEFDFM